MSKGTKTKIEGIFLCLTFFGGLFLKPLIALDLYEWHIQHTFGLPTVSYWSMWGILLFITLATQNPLIKVNDEATATATAKAAILWVTLLCTWFIGWLIT